MELNVLFVDDEQTVTEAIARNLRRVSCTILRAGSAKEAMIIMEQEPVQVLVSDERMPGMTGTELLMWAKENHPKTLRLMLSGETGLGGAVRAISETDLYLFIPKPVAPLLLSLIVSRALEFYALRDATGTLLQNHLRERTIVEVLKSQRPEIYEEIIMSMRSGSTGVEVAGNVTYDDLSDAKALTAHVERLFGSAKMG